jgi:hypothetical protein
MVQFLFGLYLVVVGARGNAGALISDLETDGAFIPFITALGIFYFLWEDTPPPEKTAMRTLIAALGVGVVISQEKRITNGIAVLWQTLKDLSGGNFVSTIQDVNNLSNVAATGTTTAGQAAFVQSILPAATTAANTLGVPVSAIIGQAALESGWGTSNVAQNDNNLFGINVAGAATGENYQTYPSQTASIAGLTTLLQTQYPAALGVSSPLAYGQALQAGGYATDPNYATSLANTAASPVIQNILAPLGLK